MLLSTFIKWHHFARRSRSNAAHINMRLTRVALSLRLVKLRLWEESISFHRCDSRSHSLCLYQSCVRMKVISTPFASKDSTSGGHHQCRSFIRGYVETTVVDHDRSLLTDCRRRCTSSVDLGLHICGTSCAPHVTPLQRVRSF